MMKVYTVCWIAEANPGTVVEHDWSVVLAESAEAAAQAVVDERGGYAFAEEMPQARSREDLRRERAAKVADTWEVTVDDGDWPFIINAEPRGRGPEYGSRTAWAEVHTDFVDDDVTRAQVGAFARELARRWNAYQELAEVARHVVDSWESGDLAGAVRGLDEVLP